MKKDLIKLRKLKCPEVKASELFYNSFCIWIKTRSGLNFKYEMVFYLSYHWSLIETDDWFYKPLPSSLKKHLSLFLFITLARASNL